MFLDIFSCLQKVNVVVNMVAKKTCDYRSTFRAHPNIYDADFFLVNGFQPSTFYNKKSSL